MAVATTPIGGNPLSGLTLEGLRRRSSAKWRYYPEDVLPLWVAEMDAEIDPSITAAVTDALAISDTGYPDMHDHSYAEALASFAADRWNWSLDPALTVRVTDVMTGILNIVSEAAPGATIVATPPVYPPFIGVAKTLRLDLVHAPLGPGYRLDLDAIDAALATASADGRRAVFLLSNPHNPTGTVHTREELAALAALARRHGALVVSDEIHSPLIMPTSTYVPYLSVAGTEPDLAVVSSSKGWNLAGFKAALAMAGSEAKPVLEALDQRTGGHAGHIGVIAHTAALNHARPWLDAVIAGIDENRQLLSDLLRDHLPSAVYLPPEATYLAWIDCRALGLGDDPAAAFLERGRVAVNSGLAFGPGGEGHVRLNLATDPAILAEAVRRMGSVLA